MRKVLFNICVLAAASLSGGQAAATLIVNGGFETVNAGVEPIETFPSWSEFTGDSSTTTKNSAANAVVGVGAIASTSAELTAGATNGGAVRQSVTDTPAFTLSLKFSALLPDGAAAADTRYFSMQMKHGGATSTDQINLRVIKSGQVQVFSGTWQNVGSLTANFTTDGGTLGDFDGETPIVNTLVVTGEYSAVPTYSMTLNGGAPVLGLTLFQNAAPTVGNGVDAVAFSGALSTKNFLLDDVTLVPEPATAGLAAMLAAAGLLRRRATRCRPL